MREETKYIGRPVQTTMLDIAWHIDEIERKFDIIEIRNKDPKDRDKIFAVTDPVNEYVKGERIWSTCYTHNRRVYLLMEKNPANRQEVLEYLRSKGGDFVCDQVTAAEMLERDERTLFSLFMYAVRRIDLDGFAYNNINGCLFQTFKTWTHKNKLQALQFSVRNSAVDRRKLCIEMNARSMAALRMFPEKERKELYKRAQYRYEDNEFRRVYDCKPSNLVIRKAPGANNAKVVYLDLKKEENYSRCKVRNFNVLLERMNRKFAGLLEASPAARTIVEDIPTDRNLLNDFASELTAKVHDYEYNIVDNDRDGETGETARMAAEKLRSLFGIEATVGTEVLPGKFNLRVIHNRDYYEEGSDPHDHAFPGMTVQHMTVEDFGNGDDSIQDSALFNVIIKELFIKHGNLQHEDILGRWGEKGYKEDYVFITRRKIKKTFYCFKHVMKANGRMESDLVRDDDPLFDVCGRIWPHDDRPSDIEQAIVKGGSVCTITNTRMLPIPDRETMDESMKYLGGGRGSGGAGKGPRGHLTVEKTLYCTLDIKRLDYGEKLLYLCGYSSANIINQEKGPNIRLVECFEGENFFDEILQEMEVPFVRYGQVTVLPYPFKYLSEFAERYEREHCAEFPDDH